MADAKTDTKQKLVAALQRHFQENWQQIAGGEELSQQDIETKSAAYAHWYADQVAGGGEQADQNITPEGALTPEYAETVSKDASRQYATFKAGAQAGTPIVPQDKGADVPGAVSETVGGEQAERRNPTPEMQPQSSPETPPSDGTTADTNAADTPQNAGEEGAAQTPPEQDGQAQEPAPQSDNNGKFNGWAGVDSVYAPYSYSKENEVGNGNVGKEDVHQVTDENFFKLDDYNTMRQLAVFYGGYERDPKFRKAIEQYAQQNNLDVNELLKADADRKFAFGEGDRKEELNGQQLLHRLYLQNSLLMSDPLQADRQINPEVKDFGYPLTEAGLLKKPRLMKLFQDQDYIFNETGSNQLAHGSMPVFRDKTGSMYGDDGEKVFMRLATDGNGQVTERFRAEHAINMARIYMSARQRPTEDGSPQHMKYSIGSGLGKLGGEAMSKFRGNNGVYAQRRDMMILGALHQGKQAGIMPDLYEKSAWGNEKAIGPLNIKDLNPSALSQFEKLGIDVGGLLNYHNSRFEPKLSPSDPGVYVEGEPVERKGPEADPEMVVSGEKADVPPASKPEESVSQDKPQQAPDATGKPEAATGEDTKAEGGEDAKTEGDKAEGPKTDASRSTGTGAKKSADAVLAAAGGDAAATSPKAPAKPSKRPERRKKPGGPAATAP